MATVEFALIFPLVLMVTFAMMEYGWMFLKQEQLVNVAQQATRIAAGPDAANSDVTNQISTMMTSYGMGSSGYSYSPSPMNVVVATGTSITVQVSVPYKNIQVTGVSLFPVPTTLSASITMLKEGP